MNPIITPCPHCFEEVLVYPNEVNCSIFRHAVFISEGGAIPPHSSKEVCERLVEEGKVYGCGKPFRLFKQVKKFSHRINHFKRFKL